MASWADLKSRATSAVVLVIAVVVATLIHPLVFDLMVLIGTVVLWREWSNLTANRGPAWMFGGIVYLGLAAASLIYLRHENIHILFATFVIVWTGDIAAYFVGKKYGKHKIAPTISPGKSWEGLGGSIGASALIAAILGHVAPLPHAILGAAFAVIGLGGDLFESSMKRHAGVKDSGQLIPGHGGLFDRVDALLPCAIFAAIALYFRTGM